MISKMTKPEEVLIVENDQGEVVREFMKVRDELVEQVLHILLIINQFYLSWRTPKVLTFKGTTWHENMKTSWTYFLTHRGFPKKDARFLKIQIITNLLSNDNEGKIMKNIEFWYLSNRASFMGNPVPYYFGDWDMTSTYVYFFFISSS